MFSLSRRFKLKSFHSKFFSTITTKTLHEESAAGLNGRLARLSQSHSPSDLLSFYARLGPSDRSHLNLSSYNFIISALLRDGQQMEAFRLINQLESDPKAAASGFPDKTTFTVLMEGLVEADVSGSLALAVDELFELMQQRYKITADLHAWSLRIRAFLHAKFLNPSANELEPARIFYHEMLKIPNQKSAELNEIRADLVVTAVSRRLWTFAEWMLTELPTSSNSSLFQDKIANAAGLFLDPASIPVLRYLTGQKNLPADSIINSFGFNRQLLLFCWRQGRASADLAILALQFLLNKCPTHSRWWLETAEGCLNRELPRDYYIFDTDETKERLISTVQRIKCPDSSVRELEQEILHQKLLL